MTRVTSPSGDCFICGRKEGDIHEPEAHAKYERDTFRAVFGGCLECAAQGNNQEHGDHAPQRLSPASEKKETNPKDGAAMSRLDMSLVPGSARAYIALALTEGDCKYGGYNWRVAGVKVSVYVAACARHLEKWWNGEDVDPVSKVPHLANAMASLAIIVDAFCHHNAVDDRPPKQEMAALLSEFEGIVKRLQALYPDGPGRYTEEATKDVRPDER